MTSALLNLGIPGLTKGDLNLRWYLDGVADNSQVANMTVTEVGDGDYQVGNLPTPPSSSRAALTYEHPPGVGGHHHYPADQGVVPAALVIPVREAGLGVVDFDLSLYKDGELQAVTLGAAEVGAPGDYAITGFPDQSGKWRLVWRRNGLSFFLDFQVTGVPAGMFQLCDVLNLPARFRDDPGARSAVASASSHVVGMVEQSPHGYQLPDDLETSHPQVWDELHGYACALAVGELTSGKGGQGSEALKNRAWATIRLKQIANGERRLSLPVRKEAAGIAVIGTRSQSYPDSLWDGLANPRGFPDG